MEKNIIILILLIGILPVSGKETFEDSNNRMDKSNSGSLSDTDHGNRLNTTHQAWISLTVAESKRLIAKGLVNYPQVMERLNRGYVIVTKGTTNTYLAEELINVSLAPGEFVLGHILPEQSGIALDRSDPRRELVLKNGVIQDIPFSDALEDANEGDIVFKGANIINHQMGQAGVLIGSPTGGTTGVIVPKIEKKNLRLIIPVGLEKESTQDIDRLGDVTRVPHSTIGRNMPYIWSIKGELFTELEAIRQFADVDVVHLASGGIGGAEGAVTLCIRGSRDEVEKALAVVRSIQGEPPYLEKPKYRQL